MMDDNTEFRIQDDFSRDLYAIIGMDRDTGYAMMPVEIKKIKRGDYVQPFVNLSKTSMQSLFDEMYKQGFRPTEVIELGGATNGAMQRHIDDLQKIAFKTLKIGE